MLVSIWKNKSEFGKNAPRNKPGMRPVTKSAIADFHTCRRLAHLAAHDDAPPVFEDNLYARQGREVTIAAANFFGANITIPTNISAYDAAQLTETALRENKLVAEATFISEHGIVRCDLARRTEEGVAFTEVKSGTHSAGNIVKYRDDVVAQAALLSQMGEQIARAEIALVNPDAVGPDAPDLFVATDITGDIIADALDMNVAQIAAAIAATEPPSAAFCKNCAKCNYLRACWPEYPEIHATIHIPRLHFKKLEQLHNAEIYEGRRVTINMLTERQNNVVHCWREKQPYLNVAGFENSFPVGIPQPGDRLHFLDFEAACPPIPLFHHHKTFTQIPFQFSLHTAVVNAAGKALAERHKNFLHTARTDPTKPFLSALVRALGNDEHPILVFSNYERKTLNNAVAAFPEFQEPVDQIIARFVDLHKIIADHLHHPAMNGRTSIKVALPALAPNFSYDDLSIRDGSAAAETWLAMRQNPDRRKADDLRDYCGRDTEAMIYVLNGMLQLRDRYLARDSDNCR